MRQSGKGLFAWRRAVSVWVVLCLALTPAAGTAYAGSNAAEPPLSRGVFPVNLNEINVPANIGSVEEAYQGDERLVILVQDAHSIPNAQRNIRNLIDFFQQTHGLDTIAVEGARAPLDAQIFRSFPDREKLKAVFSRYLEAGELTGTTFAAVFNSREADYRDIEDWTLFEEGYGDYLSGLERAPETEKHLAAAAKELERQKEKAYSPQLLQVDRAVRDFREHSANLMNVLEILSAVKAPPEGSELALMLEESAKTDESRVPLELEVKSISEKVRKYFQSHPSSGGTQTVSEFNSKLQAFQTSQLSAEQFAVYLKTLALEMKFPVKFSGDFQSRVKKQLKIEDIDGTRFFASFEQYAAEVKDGLFRSEPERALEVQTERLYLLERLKSLELTREQWQQLKKYARRGSFAGPNHIFLDESDVERLLPEPELRKLLEANLSFYENSEKRDEVFARNLESILAASGHQPKAVMLVSGGFHTEGVLSRLKEKGISTLLLLPKIDSLPEQIHYQEHMKGLVSWRNYFEPEGNGEVNVYKAFVRATRDQLTQDAREGVLETGTNSSVVLKEWRDQIIRDLAQKGKTAEASKYTRFIDEAGAPGESRGGSGEIWEKVDAFVSGLKGLKTQGQLTEPNILRLLRPASVAPLAPTNAVVNAGVNLGGIRFVRQGRDVSKTSRLSEAPAASGQPLQEQAQKSSYELLSPDGLRTEASGKAETSDGSARSELRDEVDERETFAYLAELVEEAIKKSHAGEDENFVSLNFINQALEMAHARNPEFRRFSLHHPDLSYDLADFMRGRKMSPSLTRELRTIHTIVDAVSLSDGNPEGALEKLTELFLAKEPGLINVSIHRLARRLETSDPETAERITAFLKNYLSARLRQSGPFVVDFVRYLTTHYLENGYTLVFLGRGTQQVQQTLESLLGQRQAEFSSQIIELFASSELVRSASAEELNQYLRKAGIFFQDKVVFVDTGFFASIARPLVRAARKEGVDSEFCLFCYVQTPPGFLQRIRGLLNYFNAPEPPEGQGYNEIQSLYAGSLDDLEAAARVFDDLLGKRWDTVWELQDGLPVVRPTQTPRYYALTQELMREWLQSVAAEKPSGENRSELRSDVKALDFGKQVEPILDALANHADDYQHPDNETYEAIWNFLEKRVFLQENLYGDSADLAAITGLFLRSGLGEPMLIESRYPGILSGDSEDTVVLRGPEVTLTDLGFGQNRFAYTVTVRRNGTEDIFYGKVDNRNIGKKRGSLADSSTYREMKNQELLRGPFEGVADSERPWAEQYLTARVDIKVTEKDPSLPGSPDVLKISSRWVQYGRLVEGLDLEKIMKKLRPDRAEDSRAIRAYSYALGEMAGKLFFQTMDANNEGWFFGDNKAANVALTVQGRRAILNIDSELILVPNTIMDKASMPGARGQSAVQARQELAQIPSRVLLEPLSQEEIFLPETSPENVSERQVASLFLAGFLAPIQKQPDWASQSELSTGIALSPEEQEILKKVWSQAEEILEERVEAFEGIDLAQLESFGGWMRERLNEFKKDEDAGRSELRTQEESFPDSFDENSFLSALRQSPVLAGIFDSISLTGKNKNEFALHLDGKADADLLILVEPENKTVTNLTVRKGEIFWKQDADRPANTDLAKLELLRASLDFLKGLGYKTAQFVFQGERSVEFLTEKFSEYLTENNPGFNIDDFRVDAIDSDLTLRLPEIDLSYPARAMTLTGRDETSAASGGEYASESGRSELRTASASQGNIQELAQKAGENLIRFYREEDAEGLDADIAAAVARGTVEDFDAFLQQFVASVENHLGAETAGYSQLILDAMKDISAKIQEAGYPNKKGVFVLSPAQDRIKLDRAQANAYKDALGPAAVFIGSLYTHMMDDSGFRNAAREAGIEHVQLVSNLSGIHIPDTEDMPVVPLLTGQEKQETHSRLPYMQIGILYPETRESGDSARMEETFAIFMQFVFGYVAQNKLSRGDFEFLNQLQQLAGEVQSPEAVLDLYDERNLGRGLESARSRIEHIKSELIRPLTEILGEAAPQLLGGLELGSPSILVGQIAASMKAYEAVRKSA